MSIYDKFVPIRTFEVHASDAFLCSSIRATIPDTPDIQKAIIAAVGAGISIGLLLPYSRKHEHEADRMGMRLMAMAGYQPSEAPKIWQRMEQKFGKSKVPSYLSTHPSNTDRRSKLNSQVPEMEQFYKKAPGQYGAGNSFV